MYNIFESLRISDFATVLLPYITIGEYESDLDKEAIVISLKFKQKDALYDYDSFIQRSEINLLQTKYMSAPSQDGSFYFYISLFNDAKLSEYVLSIIEDLSALSDINYFEASICGHKHKISVVNIKHLIQEYFGENTNNT